MGVDLERGVKRTVLVLGYILSIVLVVGGILLMLADDSDGPSFIAVGLGCIVATHALDSAVAWIIRGFQKGKD